MDHGFSAGVKVVESLGHSDGYPQSLRPAKRRFLLFASWLEQEERKINWRNPREKSILVPWRLSSKLPRERKS